jgi:hypothetical protein
MSTSEFRAYIINQEWKPNSITKIAHVAAPNPHTHGHTQSPRPNPFKHPQIHRNRYNHRLDGGHGARASVAEEYGVVSFLLGCRRYARL